MSHLKNVSYAALEYRDKISKVLDIDPEKWRPMGSYTHYIEYIDDGNLFSEAGGQAVFAVSVEARTLNSYRCHSLRFHLPDRFSSWLSVLEITEYLNGKMDSEIEDQFYKDLETIVKSPYLLYGHYQNNLKLLENYVNFTVPSKSFLSLHDDEFDALVMTSLLNSLDPGFFWLIEGPIIS